MTETRDQKLMRLGSFSTFVEAAMTARSNGASGPVTEREIALGSFRPYVEAALAARDKANRPDEQRTL